jgi:hypothetical protein
MLIVTQSEFAAQGQMSQGAVERMGKIYRIALPITLLKTKSF